jgi:hypothetical protein
MFSLALVIIILRNIQTCLGDIIALLEQEEAKTSSTSTAPTVTREPVATQKATFRWGENAVPSDPVEPATPSSSTEETPKQKTGLFQLRTWDNSKVVPRCLHCTRPCFQQEDYCEYHIPSSKNRYKSPLFDLNNSGAC